MQTNLGHSINISQTRRYILREINAQGGEAGGEHSKVCLTRPAAGNALGERFHMLVIEKAQKLCCFKRVKHLPCRYRAQRKS